MTTDLTMTTMTTGQTMMTTTEEPSLLRRLRVRLSARMRIVGWCVLLVAFAVGASVLLLRQILFDRLDDRINASLEQEVAELRSLATGRDPETGQPFADDIASIFDTFLARNIPPDNEALFTFVNGEPYRASSGAPASLDRESELLGRWSQLTETDAGTLETPAGPARYLAVPLQQAGETTGVFVVAIFVEGDRREVDDAIRTAAAVSGGVLVVASLLAWVVAGRVLAPIETLTETARSITESDLTRRIPVQGNDQIAELTETFNAMLDRLEASFLTQRRFMDDAGHELRTPITIIRGHLELLGDDPNERREVVDIVTDELDRMNRQVDDMLLLAKSERPDFLDREPIDLGAVTDEWMVKVRALGERQWQLDQRGSGVVVADRQRLTQAVMNLAENAARHTADGDVIALGSTVVNGDARIWVRDDGPGIHPDDQQRVFERFARASMPNRSKGSSGLGLAIVRAIAEAHGGHVELASQPGEGAVFTVIVPVNRKGDQWPAS